MRFIKSCGLINTFGADWHGALYCEAAIFLWRWFYVWHQLVLIKYIVERSLCLIRLLLWWLIKTVFFPPICGRCCQNMSAKLNTRTVSELNISDAALNKSLGHPTHGADPQPLQRVRPALWKADAGPSRPAGQHLQNRSPCWSSRGAGGPSPEPGLTPNLQLSAPAQNPVLFHPWRPWQRPRG